ncbi:nitroreductase/quinone reductase family protein [Thermosporothrix hazakensis]|nr:nitroreductase/quinone reductase family protein [Thermosporothrix hazakensis]GCE50521.1 hypothetical protein KTH_53900 [Thermosporothrix hazakensis]
MSTEAPKQAEARKPSPVMNNLAKFILGTPLHGLFSKRLMLISFRGRKSGKIFTTPVGYQRKGDTILCFTDHKWWKNLLTNPEVTLRLQGKTLHGRAEVIHDDVDTLVPALEQYIQEAPIVARAFQIEVDEQQRPRPESLRAKAQIIAMVRIHLN